MAKKQAETVAEGETLTVVPKPIGPLPIEVWAETKGMLPQFVGDVPGPGGLEAPRMNPNYWRFAAAVALRKWQGGQEVTEAVFDEAVHLATTQPL